LTVPPGKHEDLGGKLQERHGIAKEEAKQQVDGIKKTVGQLKKVKEGGVVIIQGVVDKPKNGF